jgi:tyrosyl-tRNA synthetase
MTAVAIVAAQLAKNWAGEHVAFRTIEQLAMLAAAVRVIVGALEWLGRVYVLTDRRVMRLKGVIRIDLFECQLSRIQQVVLTMPLLEGLDGVQKMSKSLGNYIGIAEPIDEMFGKIMSISDELMWRYLELLSYTPMDEIERWKKACIEGANPRDVKARFGQEIVQRFHGAAAARTAVENFEARFKQGLIPENLEEQVLTVPQAGYPVAALLKDLGLTTGTSDSNRLIQQGGVKIDGEKISDQKLMIKAGESHVIQVGKRKVAKVKLIG